VTEQATFEQAQRELEEIVHRLERGDAPLDEALRLWQRGEELYRLCRQQLDSAEGKIEELATRAEAAKP
jgi:exodeoxyribonuclease VII small subunit